jgi:hypothetical protein
MTFGIVLDVPAPIEFYDQLHAEMKRRAGWSCPPPACSSDLWPVGCVPQGGAALRPVRA